MRLNLISFLLGLAASPVAAQDLLSAADKWWSNQLFEPSGNAKFAYGNGVFLTPDESQVIALGTAGIASSYSAAGEFNWKVDAPSVAGYAVNCLSGVAFTTENATSSYMVYSIGYEGVADTTRAAGQYRTVVVAVGMDGTKLYESPELAGLNAGTPVISNDGNYVFLTHNSGDRQTGYFTILTDSLEVVVTQPHSNGPFAPPGIYHSPAEGFYDPITEGSTLADGTGNTNDIIMWSLTLTDFTPPVDEGQLFGFQFQPGFEANPSLAEYFPIGGNDRAFRTITPPLITNQGRSAFWPASRSQYFCFIGKEGMDRARFNKGPNIKEDFGGTRNSDFPGQPIWSLPAIFDAGNETVVFGGTAVPEFFRMNIGFNSEDDFEVEWSVNKKQTSTFIYAAPALDPMQRAVYYVESDGAVGTVHQANIETLDDLWAAPLTIENGVSSEIALNKDGTVLYVVSNDGLLEAFIVAEGAPTASPSQAPAVPQPTNEPQPTAVPGTAVPTTADAEPTTEPPAPTGETSADDGSPSPSTTMSMLAALVAFTIPFLF
eukprot:scaffold1157_cov122-Cylindrotheca_fusiformis.AAC.19